MVRLSSLVLALVAPIAAGAQTVTPAATSTPVPASSPAEPEPPPAPEASPAPTPETAAPVTTPEAPATPAPEATPSGVPDVPPAPPAPPTAAAAPVLLGDAGIVVHGFVSPGYFYTTHATNYLAEDSSHGSFEFAEVGINFTKPLTDELRVGLQLFARKLGSTGNYDEKLDWAYIDYRWRDWLGVRAGRVKLPFGLYNDSSDVDAARVPVLLPQSVYPTQNRDFLLAQSGGEVYGRIPAGAAGALSYNAYYGTIFIPKPAASPVSPLVVDRLTIPYVAGGRLFWETPVPGLRVGGSVQQLRLDTRLTVLTPAPLQVEVRIPALLWVGSAEFVWGDFLVASEYSRWELESLSSEPALYPELESVNDRAYAMVTYRATDWFQPGVYYSRLRVDTEGRSGIASRQDDVAATLRFDLNPHWLVKLEGHYIEGTADLEQELNDEPLEDLPAQWGMFLVKTTAYF